jgi:hypothetical protein
LDLRDEELISLGPTGRQLPIGIAAVAVLLLLAVVKPWIGDTTTESGIQASPALAVAAVTAVVPTGAPSPAVTPGDWDNTVCASPDGWLVVADEAKLGGSFRTWLIASVIYSLVPPIRTSIPLTPLVSHSVERLGFCVPTAVSDNGRNKWSGTLWRQGGDSADPTAWREVARLNPSSSSLGAWADPLDRSAAVWLPGIYVMEARFSESPRDAWLGLVIVEHS